KNGYNADLELYVRGEEPKLVGFEEATAAIIDTLLGEFWFESRSDEARAVASLLTPALKSGGFISGRVPVAATEADQSQAGKTYRDELRAAVYGEELEQVVRNDRG